MIYITHGFLHAIKDLFLQHKGGITNPRDVNRINSSSIRSKRKNQAICTLYTPPTLRILRSFRPPFRGSV